MIEENLQILRQAFSICVWLQMYTKLETVIFLHGKTDIMTVEVWFGEDQLVDFKLENLSKKSKERIVLETEILVAQLMALKTNEHYSVN